MVIGLAALTAQASESELVRDIQRYCTVCWRNARLDPRLWDDCTQEVCCRLLTKAREGQLDLTQVLAEDTPDRRELVRAIDMVRKRVQRTKRFQTLTGSRPPSSDLDQRERDRIELGEILESARHAVLSKRQDRIIELWMRGCSVPEIGAESIFPSPGSATRSTRPCGSSSNTSSSVAMTSSSGFPLPRSDNGASRQGQPTTVGPFVIGSSTISDRLEDGVAVAVDLHLRKHVRTIPFASMTTVVRSTPMDLRPYMFFSFQTP